METPQVAIMWDDFAEDLKREISARVGYICSNPRCGALTSGPRSDSSKSVNVGVAAHITAASPGGPRYNSAPTPESRRHPDNATRLCQTCSKLWDTHPSHVTEAL